MRKAFDANVPRFRPRLKTAAATTELQGGSPPGEGEEQQVEAATTAEVVEGATATEPTATEPTATATESTATAPTPTAPTATAAALDRHERSAGAAETKDAVHPSGASASVPQAALAFDETPDVRSRRERLMAVKRKVAAAVRPAPPMPSLPETPARAGESALLLVKDFEAQLTRAREVETALRADLDDARAELARGATEGRRAVERLAAVEQQVEEKRAVLEEMLAELSALEEERDGAVARAQALSALDEERQALLDAMSARAEQAEQARGEAEAEVGRLGAELDERAGDLARLRAALAQVTRERDDVARELAEARRERDELAEARRALEQVHEALATARARLG